MPVLSNGTTITVERPSNVVLTVEAPPRPPASVAVVRGPQGTPGEASELDVDPQLTFENALI